MRLAGFAIRPRCQTSILFPDPTIMRRLSSVVPLLSLFLLVPLGEASGQTLPSLPKLQEGQSWGGFIRGGMTLASGEMDARSIDAASAVVFGRP